jgi:ABC-type uncharacterized transport system substrate-binding protein
MINMTGASDADRLTAVLGAQAQVAQRLTRICVAYSLSNEATADMLDQMARTGGEENAQAYRLRAKHAREAAAAARLFLDAIERFATCQPAQ